MPDYNASELAALDTVRPEPGVPGDWWSRALIARLTGLAHGRLTLQLPDRSLLRLGARHAEPAVGVALHRPRVARRLALGGSVGFAESYMDGDWDTPDLAGLIRLAILNERALGLDCDGNALTRALGRLHLWLRRNSRRGSRRNVAYHYDLGNEFYAAWLDPGMTYSAAMFADASDDLERAQARKYCAVADLLELAPGQALLEIGCGWGGFAELAAGTHGCHVTGLTLSPRQRDYAARRLAGAGLAGRSEILLQDYRLARGAFDRIASIEMIEAVGARHWRIYFRRLGELLKPGGAAVLQAITIADERFASYRRCPDFIQRYIFPGGMLPCRAIMREVAARTGLALVEGPRFGLSYARTLALWQERFQAAWPRIAALGFDQRFKRMWEYYLAYCEAGFRAGTLDVGLYRLERAG